MFEHETVRIAGPVHRIRNHVESCKILGAMLLALELDYLLINIPYLEGDSEITIIRAPIGPFENYSVEALMALPVPDHVIDQIKTLFPNLEVTVINQALTLEEFERQIATTEAKNRSN